MDPPATETTAKPTPADVKLTQQKPSTTKTSTPIVTSSAAVIAPIIPTPAPVANVLGDVVSRDDLLSHLLNMGFPESDCLAAISSCGLNVDMAVSWLCDRPAQPKTKQLDPKEAKKTPGKAIPTPTQEVDSQLKSQKDREQKEEQRRINRAWNARAEEERKKVFLFSTSNNCSI